MGHPRDLGGVPDRQRLAHRMGVGVLDRDQAADRLVRVARVAEGIVDLGRVDGPVRPLAQGPNARPDDDRVTGRLVEHDVAARCRDRLLAPGEVGQLGDEVALGPARHEQAGFLAEQLGRPLLERVDRGIVAEHVVADLGCGHRPTHLVGRLRDGVRAQIDPVHGGPSIGRRPVNQGQPGCHLLSSAFAALDPWCSGPTCQPVTLEIAGSNPVGSAIDASTQRPVPRPDGAFFMVGPTRTRPSGRLHQ